MKVEKKFGATVAINNTMSFLELGYVGDTNYQLTTALEGITIFQEAHKESIAFSKDGFADIISEDNSSGIYKLTSPKKLYENLSFVKRSGTVFC